jgi:hydroxyacylglutathione hydrolase
MHLVFEQIRVGGDRNFGYLLGDRQAKTAVLIDPSYTPEECVKRATEQDLKVSHIINTHGHADHINGNTVAAKLTNAPVAAHPDSPAMPDIRIQDGQEMAVGSLQLAFYHVPGHCEDHIVIYEKTYHILITGDLIFVGKVGGTTDDKSARVEWNSLQRVLQLFPTIATVWPGHDYGARPSSTLAMEKASNPFLLCADLPAFLRLKDDWKIYKSRHGLK